MGKRLSESVKLIMKGYRRKMKKQRWEKTLPLFRNYDIDPKYKTKAQSLRPIITDILDIEDGLHQTQVTTITQRGPKNIISHIVCPYCNRILKLNDKWNCYICECNEQKKIFEIVEVGITIESAKKYNPALEEEENSY